MNGVRRFLRPGWLAGHLLVVLAVLVCLRLAWWQLDRSEETDGTIQNVGYALLWPAFGVAFIYMWVRFMKLELERAEVEEQEHAESLTMMLAEAEALTAGAAPVPAGVGDPAEESGTMDETAGDQPADFVGIVGDEDDDDPELNAYNRALAALAEKDRRAR